MRVDYKITADGQDITALIDDRLISAEITDQAGIKSDRLTLTIDDRDQRLELPATGAKLEVSLGYVDRGLIRMGKYVVDEIEVTGPARELVIRANAANMTGEIKAPKERSWFNVKFGDMVRKIASEHRLVPSIADDLANRQLGHIDQTESDMQLLTRVCSDQSATCKIADGRLVVANRAKGKTTKGTKLPDVVISADQCDSWTATIAERGKYSAVVAQYQDLDGGERKSVKAGSGKPQMTLKNTYDNQASAKRAAESRLKAMSRGKIKVSIIGFVGDPTMSAERTGDLVGFRDGIDGQGWVVNKVTLSFSSSGYTNSIDLESKD